MNDSFVSPSPRRPVTPSPRLSLFYFNTPIFKCELIRAER